MKIDNVEGIIWDLDGTLLDSFGIFEHVIADIVEERGHTMPTREYMMQHYHGSLEESVQNVLGLDSAEELQQTVTAFLAKQETHYEDDLETHLFNDATVLAQQAASKMIHQLLVTNRDHAGRGNASPKVIIAATTLADCIHEIYPGDEVEFRKPDKRSTGAWMETHGLTPDRVLVIGDQYVDAQLALNIGARAVLIKRNGTIPHLDNLSQTATEHILITDSLQDIELT